MAGIGTYKPIKIYQISSIQNANGDMIENTTLLFTAWAEVEDIGGTSTLQNGKTNLQDTKRFKVKFRPDMILTSNWIIQYYGKIYEISNIQRIDEKRFNYLITATGSYNTLTTINTIFPDSTPAGGGGGGTSSPNAVNWTSIAYDQALGGLTLSGGSIDTNWTNIQILKYPYDGTAYVSAYGEAFGTGPFSGSNAYSQGRTLFTPGQALLRWWRVQGAQPFAQITQANEQVITITRLAKRFVNVFRNYGNFLQLPDNAYPFRAYDVANNDLGVVNSAAEYISVMNASAANQACFNMIGDASDTGGMKFFIEPLAPYQSWNFGPPINFYAGLP